MGLELEAARIHPILASCYERSNILSAQASGCTKPIISSNI